MSNQNSYRVINVLSFAIPVVVAVLLGVKNKLDLGEWTKLLPHINAIINFLTSVLLVIGFVAIKNKRVDIHRLVMLGAFGLGSLFLVSYVLYHMSNPSTKFGGEGIVAYLYYFLLITHIVLAAVVVRFVLMALYYAIQEQFDKHKNTVKYAFPIWLYVSTTGVIVYWMISPYYK